MPKNVKSFKYNGTHSFNASHVSTLPIDRFVKENEQSGLSVDQLKEVHGLALKEVAKPDPSTNKAVETKK